MSTSETPEHFDFTTCTEWENIPTATDMQDAQTGHAIERVKRSLSKATARQLKTAKGRDGSSCEVKITVGDAGLSMSKSDWQAALIEKVQKAFLKALEIELGLAIDNEQFNGYSMSFKVTWPQPEEGTAE